MGEEVTQIPGAFGTDVLGSQNGARDDFGEGR